MPVTPSSQQHFLQWYSSSVLTLPGWRRSVTVEVRHQSWICGDTTYAWKQEHGTQYEVVYGAYKGKESQQIYFVPFMTDGSGVNTPTNNPSEDPDIAGSGYYGSASRTNKNWVSSNRPTHFSSWARRGIIPDRMATAILNVAGRTLAFISGKAPEIKSSPGGDTPSGPSEDASVRTISLLPTAGMLLRRAGALRMAEFSCQRVYLRSPSRAIKPGT